MMTLQVLINILLSFYRFYRVLTLINLDIEEYNSNIVYEVDCE